MGVEETKRRPLRSRETKWAAATARWLRQAGIRPNQISVLSVVFSAVSAMCLILAATGSHSRRAVLFVAAAIFIQLRLLCNLFDGMVAVEGGLRTKSGEIFNDLPDRLSDPLIFVGAGYSITIVPWGGDLGWAAGLLSVLTAYVRVLGASAGAKQYFSGPMAKQQRMAVMTAACLIAVLEVVAGWPGAVVPIALGIIIIGCVATIVRRTRFIVSELEAK